MPAHENYAQPMGKTVRAWICGIALILLAPAIAGFFTDHEERSQWEKRRLTSWEEVSEARGNKVYFATLDSFIDDHIGFAIELNRFYRKTLFYIFNDAAVGNISVGEGGMVFLTGHSAKFPYSALRRACLPHERWTRRTKLSMRRFSQWFEDQGVRLTYAIVPSKPLIYGDRLPASLPLYLREACANTPAEDVFASQIAALGREGRFRIVYPLKVMRRFRDMEAFYPPGNFHANSALNHYFSYLLLKYMDITPRREFKQDSYLSRTRPDLKALGFWREVDVWTYPYNGYGVSKERKQPSWVEDISPITTDFATYTTATPDSDKRALVLSNSFGSYMAPHLAPGFSSLLYINLNGAPIETRLELTKTAMDRFQPDEVVFLIHDGGLPLMALIRLTEEFPEFSNTRR